jgi:hypothetical protein
MMKKYYAIACLSLLFALTTATYAGNSVADVPILWTAVFSQIQPTSTSGVTQEYCVKHSPTTLITTYQQINSKKGVTTLNGVNIRYLNYKTENKNDMYFYIVHGELSGKDGANEWKTPITLYEQTLTGNSTIWTTWGTPQCKGIFIANPTFPDKQQQEKLSDVFDSLTKLSK